MNTTHCFHRDCEAPITTMHTSDSLINKAAILVKPNTPLEVQDRPVPIPGQGQLLLRSHSVAINPSDWMMQQNKTQNQLPLILGSDIAGTVEAIGDESHSPRFRVGDRVCAFTGGSWSGNLDSGAFQQYVIVSANSTAKIPFGVSFEKAATLPMASATAASALWETLGITRPIPGSTDKPYQGQGILIYGASSSVGIMAVQMAARQGFQVFAVASSKHKGYICSLGAQHFFDRYDKDLYRNVADTVQKAGLKEPLRYIFDAVSSRESLASVTNCLAAISFDTKAKLAITLNWPEDLDKPRNIEIERMSASHFHVKEENSRWLFNQYLEDGLQRGTLIPGPPVRIVDGGLYSISKALSMCKQGLSCEKLVLNVS
jgi:NADPH:quinone reductase-like Zn-dependent oxidoreductase